MGRIINTPRVESKTCPICQHKDRAQIEQLILAVSPSNPTLTLDVIADAFGVNPQDLRVHALMHTPLALDFSEESEASLVNSFQQRAQEVSVTPIEEVDGTSSNQSITSGASDSKPTISGLRNRLTDKLNLRESDMLLASATEMLTTLTSVGRKIKSFGDQQLVNFLTNAMVSLYTGTAGELRKTIEEINHMNATINGENNGAATGLQALAAALAESEKPRVED